MGSASRDQVVIAAIRQWQAGLLQLDRRNTLLYFPKGKRGVSIRDVEPDPLLRQLIATRKGLSFDYVERVKPATGTLFEWPPPESDQSVRVRPGQLKTDLSALELQKRLTALSKRAREWQEEQGLNVLFIALGFLRWVDEGQEVASSPVLLAPCELTRTSPRDPFYLTADESEEPVVNATLSHKLLKTAGLTLPELGDGTIAEYWAEIERLIAGRQDWFVDPSIVISTFPFSKLAMWEDLEQMASEGTAHPLVRGLAGDPDIRIPRPRGGGVAIPGDDAELKGGRLDDLLDVRDQHAVLDADFSQLRAIELARGGSHMVIHGPPGTGKSQTIANIIATLLGDGRRVLFVSEKTAALDVVKRRLEEVKLGGFCLDLHSDRGKKASVYQQVRQALNQSTVLSGKDFSYEGLAARRKHLNAIVRALHEVRQPLGVSAFVVQGRLASIGDAPRLRSGVHDSQALDRDRLAAIEEAAARISRRPAEFRQHNTSRWRSLGPVASSPGLAGRIDDDLSSILTAVEPLQSTGRHAATLSYMQPPNTLLGTERLVELLGVLKKCPGRIPVCWLDARGLDAAREWTKALRADAEFRHRLLDELSSWVVSPSPEAHAERWLDTTRRMMTHSARWASVIGQAWERDLLEGSSTGGIWRQVSNAVASVVETSSQLQRQLGMACRSHTRGATEQAIDVARRLLSVGVVPANWNSVDALEAVRREVVSARALCDELAATEKALGDLCGLEVTEHVDETMLARFRTDHRSIWRWCRASYRSDVRTLRACLKRPVRLSLDLAANLIDCALSLKRLRQRWSEAEPGLKSALGSQYVGRASHWSAIESKLNVLTSIYQERGFQVVAVHSSVSDPQRLERLGGLLAEAELQLKAADELWPSGSTSTDTSLVEVVSIADGFSDAAEGIQQIIDGLGTLQRRPESLDELSGLLEVGKEYCELERRAAAESTTLQLELGEFYAGWATDFAAMDVGLAWAKELRAKCHGGVPAGLAEQLAAGIETTAFADEESALADAVARLRTTCSDAAARFPEDRLPWFSWDSAQFDAIRAWCEDLRLHAQEAIDWVEYRQAIEDLDAAVGEGTVETLRGATDDAVVVPAAVGRCVYESWLNQLYETVPELQFAPTDIEVVIQEFRTLDKELPKAARDRVKGKCLSALEGLSNVNGMGELGVLTHQLSLRKSQLPVRKLIQRIPNLLQKLKPCFMMSPLAVSQFLPRGAGDIETLSFDAVIFDEASQVFPEDAIPAIARGRQCIVVGDQQQLPPTRFFRSDEADEDYDEEVEAEGNRLRNVESILDAMIGMSGAGAAQVYLKVHYRSQHDDLIRYSNRYFYEDRLITFPSAYGNDGGLGVRSVFLEKGRYEAGGSRTNRAEAEEVVRIAFDLMRRQPETESIGVVALSRAQADLIQQLVDNHRLGAREFDSRFAEDRPERFFVKNLESVQGDERDHIVLSIGYGPTAGSGQVPNRFGPVNADGGHRRLNVAVSRARKSMTVVHSLSPGDIRSEVQGALLLRRYLEFVRGGGSAIPGPDRYSGGGDAESPFEEAVGQALTQRGYRIARQVGCMQYSIDIAVCSDDGRRFDLGIECDGATYHSSPSARDRDRLRQEILERMGWKGRIHRVWSTAWIRNPRKELESIERAISKARTYPLDTPRPPPGPPDDDLDVDGDDPPPDDTLLPPYASADLTRFPRTGDLRQEIPSRVAELVAAVVKVESPVHVDLVVERVRDHYGLQRAGSRVREAVLRGVVKALRQGSIKKLERGETTEQKFLASPEEAVRGARGPLADGSVRPIEHVSILELAAGVLRVARALGGAARHDLVRATARAFGYGRKGELVDRRISLAVDHVVASGTLVERMGSLVATEQRDAPSLGE